MEAHSHQPKSPAHSEFNNKAKAMGFSPFDMGIEDLNDDCLLEIIRKVPSWKLEKLQKVSTRWKNLVLALWRQTGFIDLSKGNQETLFSTIQLCGPKISRLSISVGMEELDIQLPTIITQHCKSLKHLSMEFKQKPDPFWWDLFGLDLVQNLNSLKLDYTKIDSNGIVIDEEQMSRFLGRARVLTSFAIHSEFFGGSSLSALPQTCKNIDVSKCKRLSPSRFQKALKALPYLEKLKVDFGYDLAWSSPFENAPNLSWLSLARMYHLHSVIDRTPTVEFTFEKLVYLNLHGSYYLNDQHLIQLAARSKMLKHLNISSCRNLTDVGFRALTECKKLETLAFDYVEVTEGALVFTLGRSDSSVTEISCVGCKNLKDKGLIRTVENLKELTLLIGCSFTKPFVESIFERHQRRERLRLCVIYEQHAYYQGDGPKYNQETKKSRREIVEAVSTLRESLAVDMKFGVRDWVKGMKWEFFFPYETNWMDADTVITLFEKEMDREDVYSVRRKGNRH